MRHNLIEVTASSENETTENCWNRGQNRAQDTDKKYRIGLSIKIRGFGQRGIRRKQSQKKNTRRDLDDTNNASSTERKHRLILLGTTVKISRLQQKRRKRFWDPGY